MENIRPTSASENYRHYPQNKTPDVFLDSDYALHESLASEINELDLASKSLDKGYRSARSLKEELRANEPTIKKIVTQLIAENPSLNNEIITGGKSYGNSQIDIYSPVLVSLIQDKLGEKIKDGYQTANQLKSGFRTDKPKIKQIVEKIVKDDPRLETQIQRNIIFFGKSTEAYSPELIALIAHELGEPIREGYQTAGQLAVHLSADPKTIREIAEKLISKNKELESMVQHQARLKSVTVDAYSPELIALIAHELGEPIREGYQTARQLAVHLSADPKTIRNIIGELILTNPTLSGSVQKNASVKGQSSNAYSPELIALVTQELAGSIREGYRSIKQLELELKSDRSTISKTIQKLTEEDHSLRDHIQHKARVVGRHTDAYSPVLVEKIREVLGDGVRETYLTARKLGSEIGADPYAIKSIVEKLIAEDPTLEAEVQRDVRVGPTRTDAYSPVLVEKIRADRGEFAYEHYRSANDLQEIFAASANTIKSIVEKLIAEDSTLEAEVQRDVRVQAKRTDVYSPTLVKNIEVEIGDRLRESYQTANQLQATLSASSSTIKSIVEKLIAEDPTLEAEVQRDANVKGQFTDAYSLDLIEKITEVLGKKIHIGYQTPGDLESVLKSNPSTIKSIVEKLIAEDSTLEAEVQRDVRVGSMMSEAYSPRLIEKINESYGESLKAGYLTASQLMSGLSTSLAAIKSVVMKLITKDPTLEAEVQRSARNGPARADAYSPRLAEEIRKFFESRESNDLLNKFRQNSGLALQFATEVILRIVDNKNLLIEKNIKNPKKDSQLYPDLMRNQGVRNKALISDIKLQTTTKSIREDTKNYTRYIKENYPEGGDLIFLCLNGPDLPNEVSQTAENIKVRYYHILDFLERLTDNSRNKFMLRLMTGDESESLNETAELSPEQIDKIREIIKQLKILKGLVSNEQYSTRDISLEEAVKHMSKIRAHMRKLARGNVSLDDILNTDFKEVMDF